MNQLMTVLDLFLNRPSAGVIMCPRNASIFVLCGLIASAFMSNFVMADTATAEPSKELRAKMADAHEQMAACLRTDRAMSDCREEMMKECHQLMGEHGCPMMGMDKHKHMMKSSKPPVPKEQ
ncbi:MAG TPA: hypothetical protein VN692_14855 [Steroidobacteraceae bacterium]|nr:hypothetical protein [Steroidobacteraceae bacterium]